MRVSGWVPLAVVVGVMALAGGAHAGTSTGSLTVQATVSDACSVTDANLNLGQVNPTVGVTIPATGIVNVTCSLGTTFAVGLGDGLNSSGAQRRMRRGASSDYLDYNLYKDLLMTSRFGDATVGERLSGLLGLGLAATPVTVYATVASGQSAGAGSYADTVQITVYF